MGRHHKHRGSLFMMFFGLLLVVIFFLIWAQTSGGVDYIGSDSKASCQEPIAYNVGSFDRRFGISYTDFLGALSLAEAIWEKRIDKELFIYDPESAELSVNLVYDYRQETTSTLSGLGDVLEENETSYKALQSKYLGLKTEYNNAKSLYDTRVEMFNKENSAYQKQVEDWNKGRRDSRAQFERLEKDKLALEVKLAELRSLETALNERVREINSLVGTLNRMAESLNLGVKAYNTIGASRGESFTGGVYYSVEGEQGINVYEFSSQAKLVRVLAHELGHALGLEHNNDPEAIMYYLNESDAGVLSETDLATLQSLCYN